MLNDTAMAKLRQVMASAVPESTSLDPVLTKLPWQEEWQLGTGVDAITGNTTGVSAVNPFELEVISPKEGLLDLRYVEGSRDLEEELKVSASGKFNIGGVEITGSTEYLQDVKYSGRELSLIVSFKDEGVEYDRAPHPYELTSEAKELIKEPKEFRKRYGDYFIAGAKQGSLFRAVYVCQSSTAEDLQKFRASFDVSKPSLLDVDGAAEFKRLAGENNISLSIKVHMHGYHGDPPGDLLETLTEPELVLRAFSWFQENKEPLKRYGYLMHYSYFDPAYPSTIPINPRVFVDLRAWYERFWELRYFYQVCPPPYQQEYHSRYHKLESEVMAYRQYLPEDEERRGELGRDVESLAEELQGVHDRYEFWWRNTHPWPKEEERDRYVRASGGNVHWHYGAIRDHKVRLQVQAESWGQAHGGTIFSRAYHDHRFTFNLPDKLIVGYEIIPLRTDGHNGSWDLASEPMLWKDSGQIYVVSEYARGTFWEVKFYYVDRKDYLFGE